MQQLLAVAHTNRCSAYWKQRKLVEAIADGGRAIELHDALRRSLREQWSPKMRRDLARVYSYRGHAFHEQNQLKEAAADYARAIVLRRT